VKEMVSGPSGPGDTIFRIMQVRPATLFASVLLLFVPRVAPATTIVGIWTPKKITIASDSRATLSNAAGVYTGSQTVCKIQEAHGLVFALSGSAADEGISVIEGIKTSMLIHDQATGKIDLLATLVAGAQSTITKVLLAHHVARNPTVPIQLLIAGMIDGKLQMVRIDETGMEIAGNVSLMNSTRMIQYPEDRGYKGSDPNRGVEILGINDTAERFRKLLPEWNMGDDVAVATRLVAVEASDTKASQFVGPPISTIEIDKKGVRWVDKGACDWIPERPSK
jgi:hypothetical protein